MNGAASGTRFLVNVPTHTNPRRVSPAIVECAAGFVIAWIDFTLGDPTGNVKLRLFDADTFSPGDEIQVNAAPVDHNQPPQLATLSDGGFMIVWADAGADERIRAQRFDRFGNRNGSDFRANTVAGLHPERLEGIGKPRDTLAVLGVAIAMEPGRRPAHDLGVAEEALVAIQKVLKRERVIHHRAAHGNILSHGRWEAAGRITSTLCLDGHKSKCTLKPTRSPHPTATRTR